VWRWADVNCDTEFPTSSGRRGRRRSPEAGLNGRHGQTFAGTFGDFFPYDNRRHIGVWSRGRQQTAECNRRHRNQPARDVRPGASCQGLLRPDHIPQQNGPAGTVHAYDAQFPTAAVPHGAGGHEQRHSVPDIVTRPRTGWAVSTRLLMALHAAARSAIARFLAFDANFKGGRLRAAANPSTRGRADESLGSRGGEPPLVARVRHARAPRDYALPPADRRQPAPHLSGVHFVVWLRVRVPQWMWNNDRHVELSPPHAPAPMLIVNVFSRTCHARLDPRP